MILLLTKSKFEPTTEEVIDWLIAFDEKYQRINGTDFLNSIEDLSVIKSIWFWKWGLKNNFKIDMDSDKNARIIHTSILRENKAQSDFLQYKLKDKYWLSHPDTAAVNKLIVLDKAKENGFPIPDYSIINAKEELVAFKKKHNRIITKSIDNGMPLMDKDYAVLFYTQEITDHHIVELPDHFPNSFCQQFLEKKYEIRVFYLTGKMYAMAIMTPNNEVDYRKHAGKLRNVPYQLPVAIENKIHNLIKDMNLNTASIDLICGNDDVLYFLEVNPIGQIGMVSHPCNYYLEKEIATNLTCL